MRLDFINVDEFCKDLKPITSPKIHAKAGSGYDPNGLFSEQIFGPTRTATCLCNGGTYWGRNRIGTECKTCGIRITYSSERRKNFAKIELPFAVLNPIMYQLLIKAGKNKLRKMIDNLLFNTKIYGYYYNEKEDRFLALEKELKEKESDDDVIPVVPENYELFQGIEGVYQIVEKLCEKYKENELWQFISENLDKFYINNVIVPPPEIRPASRSKSSKQKDELNQHYIKIIRFSLTYDGDNIDITSIEGISQITFKELQKHIFELYDYIINKFSKKEGLIRGSILGRRIDFSGRAVISPDPSLNLGECSIPYCMVLELFKLDIANELLEKRIMKRYDRAIELINRCLETESYDLYDICCNVVKGQSIILNRQPTLHRMGLLSFTPKVNKDNVIKIHPFVCEPYNADFDGDQMAVYRPLYDDAIDESNKKLHVLNNLLCPTTGGLLLGINQDVILGLYLLTSPDENAKVKYDDIDTYTGRVLFNKCLPENYPFIDQTINKKNLNIYLDDIARTNSPNIVAKTLDKIKKLGFKYTTSVGTTMSLKEMYLKNSKEITNPIFESDKSISEKISDLHGNKVMSNVKNNFPYSNFIESGSRGSWDQANQIILSRGFVSNFKGEIQSEPIKSNLIHGLSKKEFFTSCYGSRKGLLDTALNTGVSGYLTRKLIYCASNLELDLNCDDCGVSDKLNIKIPKDNSEIGISPIKFAKSLIGRYVTIKNTTKEFLVSYENYQTIIGKDILVRSPIFCKNYNLCKKCYGDTSNIIHSPYVGILAAQALGEVSTQLVLRTFHTSGIAQKREGDTTDKQQDITDDLTLVKKLFHNSTPFVYMGEKIDNLNYFNVLMNLYKIYGRYKSILLVHYECIISQMMRVGDCRWRLSKNRDLSECELTSIESVPSKESWLLALAFSKVKHYLIDGIIGESISNAGILEKIMGNENF